MSEARLIGNCTIGGGTLIDESAIIGHPCKAAQLGGRSLSDSAGATIGANCIIRSNSVIYENTVLGDNVQTANNVIIREDVKTGDGCVFGGGAIVLAGAKLGRNVRLMEQSLICEGAVVGNDVFIAPHVSFTRGRHMLGAFIHAGRMSEAEADAMEKRYADPAGPSVIIEDDVRIGANSVLLAGVRIGKGAVIAAGSVVSLDVPENHLVVGNPARIIPTEPPPA
jgi:acetyltransferase-like isoleucine patch superfamily enzyme